VSESPGPDLLRGLVPRLTYKSGWSFKVAGPLGRFLCVFARTPDSWHPERQRTTQHMWEIPPLADERAALRWIFDRLLDIERHETGEFLAVDGHRPFYPNHQDEGSPYEPVERWERP
jgi:hypothetical protein